MSKSPSISSGSVATLPRAQLHWRPALRIILADLLLVLGLGLLIVAGTWWSYRQLYAYSPPIEEDGGLYRDGLGEAEETAEGWQRWAAPYTLVRFPGVGRANYRVALLFHNPLATAPRTLAIGVGNQELSRSTLQPGWQQVIIEVPAAAIDAGTGDLDFVLRITPSFKAGGRDLGVAVRSLQLHQVSAAQAPFGVQWALTLSALLLVIPLRLLGTPVRWVMLGAGALVLLALTLLARARIGLVITLPPLNQALVLGALGAPLLWLWVRAQPLAARPWAMGLAVVAIATFVVRFVGMQHPQFIQIDHTLRVHQIEAIAVGERARVQAELSRQYEWGRDVAVPYSLLSYDLFVPWARSLSGARLLVVVESVTAALDASVVLALWSIARRSGMDARSSWWAAALFPVFPVGYLYFHDGSFPTIIGLSATVLALWFLTQLASRPRLWLWAASTASVALSVLLYVTHLAFVPAVLGAAIASMALFGTGRLRRALRWIALATAAGFGLALIGYYGAHLPELVAKTIPSYIATLSEQGSVGREPGVLPRPLLGNTWQQLWGHYRVIGAALAALGIIVAFRQRERWTTHLALGYGIFLVLTAIADLRFGLWNKHMYFALPGVCLAAGPLLGQLHRRGGAGRLLVFALFGYLLYTSIGAWILRVIWYIWSLQTL